MIISNFQKLNDICYHNKVIITCIIKLVIFVNYLYIEKSLC